MAEKAKPEFRPDEIDPELISLKKKATGPGPVLAIAVLVMCAYQLVTLRADFGFALAGKTPQVFGPVAPAYAAGKHVPDNAHVSVQGQPDATAPGWLRGKQAVGYRLAPLVGSSGKVWIQVTDDVRTPAPAYDLTWTGRSRRIADLPLADELRRYVASLPPAPRAVAPAALAAGTPAADAFGDAIAPAADAATVIDVRVPGAALVTVYATDQVKDEAAARAGLVAAGLTLADALAGKTERSWTFEVQTASPPAELRAQLSRAGFRAALGADSVQEKVIRHELRWGQLGFDAAARAVKLPDGATVAVDQIARVTVWVAPSLPTDATIVIVGDAPGGYWYLLPLYAVLGLVSVFMVWALVRALRRPPPPPPVTDAATA